MKQEEYTMSENKEILKTNEVSAPTLFVGVGGTGVALRKILGKQVYYGSKSNNYGA